MMIHSTKMIMEAAQPHATIFADSDSGTSGFLGTGSFSTR